MNFGGPTLLDEACPMDPAPNFDGLARIYRWMEWATFGPFLWNCRSHFLSDLGKCRKALVLGDGDGRFTARLLETNPQIEIVAIDASPKMLQALLDRAGTNRTRVRILSRDIRLWQPEVTTGSTSQKTSEDPEENRTQDTGFDLVVSHFFLDCLTTEEVQALARKVQACLVPEGRWLISDFAIPHNRFGNVVARPLVSALYLSFRILTDLRVSRLPEYSAALQQIHLIRNNRKEFLGSLLVTEFWQHATE